MLVSSVQGFNANVMNAYQPRFKGGNAIKDIDKGDYIERHYQTNASSGKKWGVGLGSAFLAGLGQFINGDIGKGFAFLGGSIAAGVLTSLSFFKVSKAAFFAGLAATAGLEVWSIVDAVKNAKSETVEIIHKDEA